MPTTQSSRGSKPSATMSTSAKPSARQALTGCEMDNEPRLVVGEALSHHHSDGCGGGLRGFSTATHSVRKLRSRLLLQILKLFELETELLWLLHQVLLEHFETFLYEY